MGTKMSNPDPRSDVIPTEGRIEEDGVMLETIHEDMKEGSIFDSSK